MKRIQRHWPFLKAVLQEANRFKRQEMFFMPTRIRSTR